MVEIAHDWTELLYCNTLVNSINKSNNDGCVYHTYKKILNHRNKNKKIFMEVQWDIGEVIWESINTIKKDDPVTLAKYSKDNDLVGTIG